MDQLKCIAALPFVRWCADRDGVVFRPPYGLVIWDFKGAGHYVAPWWLAWLYRIIPTGWGSQEPTSGPDFRWWFCSVAWSIGWRPNTPYKLPVLVVRVGSHRLALPWLWLERHMAVLMEGGTKEEATQTDRDHLLRNSP